MPFAECNGIERGEVNMAEDEGGYGVSSNLTWARAMTILVGMVVGVFYYGGFLNGKKRPK